MTTQNLQETMTADDRAKFERGAELLKYMQAGKAFDDFWVPIGDGLLAVRRTVVAVLHLKHARGGYYNAAFGKMVGKTPYADMKKTERSNLLYCMEHLSDIMEMRAGWTPTERANVNHPDSMSKRLREFLNRAPVEQAPRRNVSPMALLREKKEQLERANLDQAEEIAALKAREGDGSLFDLHQDTAEEIATSIVGELSKRTTGRAKAKAIAEAVLEKLKQRPSRAAG